MKFCTYPFDDLARVGCDTKTKVVGKQNLQWVDSVTLELISFKYFAHFWKELVISIDIDIYIYTYILFFSF